MKKLFITLLLLSVTSLSYADSIRCKNKLARTGDAKAYVLEICGQPISDEVVAWENDVIYKKNNTAYKENNVVINHVTYKENGNMKILIFKGGILTSIIDAKK